MVTKKLVFCEGIECEYMKAWDEEGESHVTCTAKRCPYPKRFIKGWYKGQENTLSRICEEIEKVENDYSESWDYIQWLAWQNCKIKILALFNKEKVIKEAFNKEV